MNPTFNFVLYANVRYDTIRRSFNPFCPEFQIGTVIKGFDVRLAKRPFLVFDFRAPWRSGLSARVPGSQKLVG